MGTAFGGFGLVLIILGIVLAIAWILLPFAMFGMKPILRDILAEMKETNRLLTAARPVEKEAPKHQFFTTG